MNHSSDKVVGEPTTVSAGDALLEADLSMPEGSKGIVLFAHGSGSDRFSPRNRVVAKKFNQAGLATLLIDLLTAEEKEEDARTARLRFDIDLLAERVEAVARRLSESEKGRSLPIGCFGSSTGAAAALIAAAGSPDVIRAVVSRGGRVDLASEALPEVEAPTLFIVGEKDTAVRRLNEEGIARLRGKKSLEVVRGAGHLFEEPGALDKVADLGTAWFKRHLKA